MQRTWGEKKQQLYFHFCKKKKKARQKNENLWKKLFSGRKFLLAVCPAYSRCHVFYPSYFILFYFMLFYFNLDKECIYLNKIPLFYTLLVGWGPKVERSALQCDFVLPHTFKISREREMIWSFGFSVVSRVFPSTFFVV